MLKGARQASFLNLSVLGKQPRPHAAGVEDMVQVCGAALSRIK